MDLQARLDQQRAYFHQGRTRDLEGRRQDLRRLYQAIQNREEEIMLALAQDLNKAPFESYATEIGLVLEEISYLVRHMKKLLRPRRVASPLVHFPSTSWVVKEPYGQVLIISPWNYPFFLTLSPLVGALATGNTALVKPSSQAPHTAAVLEDLVQEVFDPGQVCLVQGGRGANQALLDLDWDLIFFTGSTAVGRQIMEKAARHLTPVVLELGGKSPCIVDQSADLRLAARRIIWGKGVNAGQTCIAPDYILVQEEVKEALVRELVASIEEFYGPSSQANPDFPKIINRRHWERLRGLLDPGQLAYGGQVLEEEEKIGLTLLDPVDWEDPIMQEEIFGPLLPLLTYGQLDQALEAIRARPKPLALYLFTQSSQVEDQVLDQLSFGGGCINDTLIHIASPHLAFGGVGASGMGSYHGRASLETFSHSKSLVKKSRLLDLPVRYPPYGDKLKWLKRLMK